MRKTKNGVIPKNTVAQIKTTGLLKSSKTIMKYLNWKVTFDKHENRKSKDKYKKGEVVHYFKNGRQVR